MKYPVKDLLEGSIAQDVKRRYDLIGKKYEAQDELDVFEARSMARTLETAEQCIRIANEFNPADGFLYSDKVSFPLVNRAEHERYIAAVKRAEEKLNELPDKSDLTVWLESVTDEFISDSGITAAGFSCSPGRLVATALRNRSDD